MSYTYFGELLRIIRIRNHEVMGDMAAFLETSVSFLSAVENGKKNVPAGWPEKIASHYKLDPVEYEKLKNAVSESKTQMKIRLTGASNIKRAMALQVERSFESMDDETAEKIIQLLEEGGKQNGL